jgi:hypothetical protein
MREILITWIRPFRMFVTEPIVLVLSLLSGFSDAIIFMFLQVSFESTESVRQTLTLCLSHMRSSIPSGTLQPSRSD